MDKELNIELYPDEEEARAQALSTTELLDSPNEERFDRLVRLAQQTMGAPAAYISLIDRERQWFKSSVGMGEVKETPRSGTFCDYAIRRSRPTVVLDATRDPLFQRSPYVAEGPKVRFYAGYPLSVQGQRVGTLCTLDLRPRAEVTPEQMEEMAQLARLAEQELSGAGGRLALSRPVTVLQAAWSEPERREPSWWAEDLSRTLEAMAVKIQHWGGEIDELNGEGARAIFREAWRAAVCAAEMQAEAACAVVLTSGSALISIQDTQAGSRPLFAGPPLRLAARALEWTEPGEILVSSETHKILGDGALFSERVRTPGQLTWHRLEAVQIPEGV